MRAARLQALQPLVSISGLPTPQELDGLLQRGVQCLVNVSGIPLGDLYPGLRLECWDVGEYHFSDIFSRGEDCLTDSFPDPAIYQAVTTGLERAEFGRAASHVWHTLQDYTSVHLFCHHGVGRSPAVALAAVSAMWRLPALESMRLIEDLRPQARITRTSLSACRWFREHVGAS